MRFGTIILAYFVIGVVMFGGGAIDYEDAGVATYFVEDPGGEGPEPRKEASDNLGGIGTAISNLVGQFVGALQLVYNLVVGLLGFLNWPVVVLLSVNAPPSSVLLLGGTMQVGFYVSVIRLFRSSA